ncbi:ABC-2 family transporter protein [Lactobacillus sp. ESL0791]|uniref:ABC transporter permease n=1 Tax=Lactobacillus sp. ESL0791 TaxID=2983234 RepID=UPI0023F99451|nr:ABC-2 family transporter protein [Lactobacillus sp. ESL0791]MDF7638438.1 ABC-2 family transporter protein [Lactobacillus sp. ESL0791]
MRYFRLAYVYLKTNLKSLAIYDVDFYFAIIGMMVQNVLNIVALRFLFNLVPTIKGFTFTQLLLTYALATLSFAIFRCFFINTLNISDHIHEGSLDQILVKPVNPLFQLINERVDEDAWGDLLVALILLIVVDHYLKNPWYITLMFIFISLFTSLIFLSLALLGNMVSLLSNGLADLASSVFDFFELSKYPLAIYSGILKVFLTFVLPLGWVAAIPQEKIAVHHEWLWLVLIPLVCVLFFILVYQVWRLFLNNYQSTGS